MENNENKTLEERKEAFKQATNQTVPVMGLNEDKNDENMDNKRGLWPFSCDDQNPNAVVPEKPGAPGCSEYSCVDVCRANQSTNL